MVNYGISAFSRPGPEDALYRQAAWGQATGATEMVIRLAIICLLSAAFGFGFAELVGHAELNPADNRVAAPCLEWSNPQCAPPALQ
jgi:hypothetical protein